MLTVFAGLPPEGLLGPWDAEGAATESRERVRERIEEDRAALSLAGCEGVYLDFLDGQYEPGEQPLAEGLRAHVEAADAVYGPQGSSLNRDHVLVRDALVAVCPALRLYADLPYSLVEGFDLQPGLDGHRLRPHDVVLGAEAVAGKVGAVRCYRTQLRQLEGFFGSLDEGALRRERTWEPEPPRGGR